MSNRFWLTDFKYSDGSILIKKTGHRVPANLALAHDVFTWLSFYVFAQSWRTWRFLTGHKRPTIAFYPDKPRPWYFIWPVMHVAGAKLIDDTSEADIVFHFDDTTQTNNPPPKVKPGARLVNFSCEDVSKSHVADVFGRIAGYDLKVDPRTFTGPMVEKSEMNAAHDGRVIEGPMEPLPGKTYQRVIDNEIEGGLVEDLRCCIVGGEPAVSFRKRRPLERRFANENSEVLLDRPANLFTPDEMDVISRFAAEMGLDWGGVDVLRDKSSRRIYIVDANKTDMGPPVALKLGGKLRATRRMAHAFASRLATKRRQARKQIESDTNRKPMAIPFVKDIDVNYGRVEQVSPLIRRVIANNPGAFTYTGTGVYIIGKGEVAVIDPGPDLPEHFEALKRAVEGETITHVVVTHSHLDHSPLAHPLAEWAGCKVYAKGPAIPTESEVRMEAGDDLSFRPDQTIGDGWTCSGPGWTLEAIETPGHTSNHVCYALQEENALFSGDHIMGWSTTVISPPDGNMSDYLASLEKVRDRGFSIIWPTHGPPITEDASGFIQAYIDHRRAREAAIIARLEAGDETIPDMVKTIYAAVDKKLHPAACHSVLGHMIQLVADGRVTTPDEKAGVQSRYTLVE